MMNKTVITDKFPTISRDPGRTIGAILVEQGRLTSEDVEKVQQFAVMGGMRFGDAAVKLNLLSVSDVDFAIAHQFKYPILDRGGEHGVADEVVAGYLPQSEQVEPLRVLRSQISLRWANPKQKKTLVIASPGRGEGRSWVAANLATVFAQMGERVLLIDADLRHPRQHELFNINNSVGLSALLTGRAGREIVRRIHPQLRLFVLPAGSLPPNPQELIGRQVFDVVLDVLASQFDIVILDTPPASESADAQMLAARADAALMVVRPNHTRVKDLKAAMGNLRESAVHVIGSVVNAH